MILSNTAEGGVSGTTVTTANSGGASGDAWDTVTIGSGAAVTFDTTHVYNAMAYRMVSGSSRTCLIWNAFGTLAEAWGRLYLYMEALPSVSTGLVRLVTGGAQVARITVNIDGTVELRNAANTRIGVSFTSLPTGQWVRLEWHCIPLASGGTIECKIFTAPDSTTEAELTSDTNAALAANITEVEYGPVNNTPAGTYWLDDLAVSDQTWVGPYTQSVSPTGVGSGGAFGTPTLVPGPVSVAPSGLASGGAIGAAFVGASILVDGIASGEAFGASALTYPQYIAPPTLPADGIGVPALIYDQAVTVVGIASGEAVSAPALTWWVLHPPVVREGPMADGPLFTRYTLYRGVSIIQRQDGTWYTARYPAQTELEIAQRFYLGGRGYPLTKAENDLLVAAGFGDYIEVG